MITTHKVDERNLKILLSSTGRFEVWNYTEHLSMPVYIIGFRTRKEAECWTTEATTKELWLHNLEQKTQYLWWQKKNLCYTRTGYGSKIPTASMVKLPGETRWRRLYRMICSNIGTVYVIKNKQRIIIHS